MSKATDEMICIGQKVKELAEMAGADYISVSFTGRNYCTVRVDDYELDISDPEEPVETDAYFSYQPLGEGETWKKWQYGIDPDDIISFTKPPKNYRPIKD